MEPQQPPLHGQSFCGFNGLTSPYLVATTPGLRTYFWNWKTLENHLCWGQPKFYKLHIRMHRYSKAIFVCIFTLKIFEVSENWPWPKVSRPNRQSAGPSLRDQNSSFLDQPIHSRLISGSASRLGYPWPVMMLGNPHVVSSTWVCLKLQMATK